MRIDAYLMTMQCVATDMAVGFYVSAGSLARKDVRKLNIRLLPTFPPSAASSKKNGNYIRLAFRKILKHKAWKVTIIDGSSGRRVTYRLLGESFIVWSFLFCDLLWLTQIIVSHSREGCGFN